MMQYTIGFAPERTTLEAVKTLGAFLVAISTLHRLGIALFNGQHIQQPVDAKVGRQVVKISTRNSILSSTFRENYDIMAATRSLNLVQAVKTIAV